MDIIAFFSDSYQLAIWASSILFIIGYTWTTKVDNSTTIIAAHVNLLQTEKLDRDGEVKCTGTMQWDKGADAASASPLVLASDGNYHDVTGTADIDEINAAQSQPGTIKKLHFDGILLIIHDGDKIILPDGKDIYTMAGTELEFICYATNKWRCTGYLRGCPVLTNLLGNSGSGYWPQSDTNKGIASLAYDDGDKQAGAAPSVGDACVGGTSGATGKVISYTTATGAWADGDAAGIVQLGAVTGCYNDNEEVTFGGVETANVNQPDGAVGADKHVKNGAFVTDNDPPNDWTAHTGATTTTEAGGQVGNCMKVAADVTGQRYAYQQMTVVIGKIYRWSVYFKDDSPGADGRIRIGTTQNGANYYDSGAITDNAWTQYTGTFEAISTTLYVNLRCETASDYVLFDEVTVYEITPCCTAADAVAMEAWIKDSTLDIYREHSGSNVQDGSFYANKMVVVAASDYVRFPGAVYDNAEWYMQFQSRIVTIGKWVKTSTASHAKLTITDSAGSKSSPYHSGGGTYEFLKVTRTINASATSVAFYMYGDVAGNVNGDTIIYHCQGMLIFGADMSEGDYQPKQDEMLWGSKPIPSNTYDGLLNQSDIAYTDLNVEADSDSMIGKGCKVIAVQTDIEDSGSGAGLDIHLELRKDATAGTFFINSVAGKPNDVHNHQSGLQPCDENGDVDIHLDASGASTLDINTFKYHGVQVS